MCTKIDNFRAKSPEFEFFVARSLNFLLIVFKKIVNFVFCINRKFSYKSMQLYKQSCQILAPLNWLTGRPEFRLLRVNLGDYITF